MATADTSTDLLCEELLKTLECPTCLKSMEAPIYQCGYGHSFCAKCIINTSKCAVCKQTIRRPVRNYSLEAMSQQVKITCEKRVHTCRCSFSNERDNARAVKVYECPMSHDTHEKCTWKGSYNHLLNHAKTTHPTDTHKLEFRPYTYNYSLEEDFVQDIGMFYLHHSIFVVCNHYDNTEEKWCKLVQLLGSPEQASKFQYKVTFHDEDFSRKLTYTRKVHNEQEDINTIIKNDQCFSIHNIEKYNYFEPGHKSLYFNEWKVKQTVV